jgi:ribosomal-protein-alanine N-acetyltransferase
MTARSEPVTIGALTVGDADRCAELESLLFPGDDPWPSAAFVRELAAANNHYVAARVGADGDDPLRPAVSRARDRCGADGDDPLRPAVSRARDRRGADGDDPLRPAVSRARDRRGETLVGYGGISRLGRTPPFEYEIHTIGVDPEYQGRGIGRRVLDELLNIAGGAVVHLEVRTDNEPAIALYRSMGFTEVGVRRHYYRISGADAYTMRRESL